MGINELKEKYTRNAIHSKIVGISQPPRQENVKDVVKAQKLFYKLEDENPYDSNAIKIFADELQTKELGYVNRELAADLRAFIAEGVGFELRATEVTGGTGKLTSGCNILVIFNGK